MGCIQPGKRTIIKTSKLLESDEKKPNGEIKELAVTQSSPTNKKRSTLKELSRLAKI